LSAEIVGVVSSRPDTIGVERARVAGLPVRVVEKASVPRERAGVAPGKDRPAYVGPLADFSERVFDAVRSFAPDLVCLAGWLHLIHIPDDFRQKVLNVHPALLPAFGGKGMYGRHVHEAVIASGAKLSGCTVHFADDTYDTGPILVQKAVPVLDNDTPETLAARVFAAECEAYPEAIRLIGERRVRVEGRRVIGSDTDP
jgi:phosphoribosylglycinamide formyltransferase-1